MDHRLWYKEPTIGGGPYHAGYEHIINYEHIYASYHLMHMIFLLRNISSADAALTTIVSIGIT